MVPSGDACIQTLNTYTHIYIHTSPQTLNAYIKHVGNPQTFNTYIHTHIHTYKQAGTPLLELLYNTCINYIHTYTHTYIQAG